MVFEKLRGEDKATAAARGMLCHCRLGRRRLQRRREAHRSWVAPAQMLEHGVDIGERDRRLVEHGVVRRRIVFVDVALLVVEEAVRAPGRRAKAVPLSVNAGTKS